MKQISNFITEKLRINKDSKFKPVNEIQIKIGAKTIFNEEEMEEIKKLSYDIPIIPDYITNYTNIFQKRSTSGYGKSFICLVYSRNDGKTTGEHYYNEIVIKKDIESKKFFIKFKTIDQKSPIYYPENTSDNFESIKQCFDCIIDKWDEVKFSEVINKYRQ